MYVQDRKDRMRFEWDEEKNRRNLIKHKLDFETATGVFNDPFALDLDSHFLDDEERVQTIGIVDDSVIVLVVHTPRNEGDEVVIRIISARKATPREREKYGQHRKTSS